MNNNLTPRPYILFLFSQKRKEYRWQRNAVIEGRYSNGYCIRFNNGDTIYKYGFEKVKIYPYDYSEYHIKVLHQRFENIYDQVDFYKDYVLLRQNNGKEILRKTSEIYITPKESKNQNVNQTLNYLRDIIASDTPAFNNLPKEILSENDDGFNEGFSLRDMILSQFDSINPDNNNRILYYYIRGIHPGSKKQWNKDTFIYPFGCNESQKKATEASINNRITIIEGPPGTGKTQTILNIIANLIVRNHSIAISSNNNAAITNIADKLDKYGYSELYALLGNKDNKESFFDEGQLKPTPIRKMLSRECLNKYENEIISLSKKLQKGFYAANKLAKYREELMALETDQKHILKEQPLDTTDKNTFEQLFKFNWTLQKLSNIRKTIEEKPSEGKVKRLLWKIKLLWKFHISKDDLLDINNDKLHHYLNQKVYEIRISELKNLISHYDNIVVKTNHKELLKRYTSISKALFDDHLAKKYQNQEQRQYSIKDYKEKFRSFVKDYPIILSTTTSLSYSLSKLYPIDYLIIDESSQVDIAKAAICFNYCKNVVVVGDSMQLTHIVSNSEKADSIYDKYKINPALDYTKYNILTSLKELYGASIPTILLREHYRCNPQIIHFCNQKFYEDKLLIMTTLEHKEPFTLIETRDGDYSKNINERQIEATYRYIQDHFQKDFSQVGVISPFRNHANELQKRLSSINPLIEADTIHKFQGREKDTIIYNFVTAQENDFTDNPNLINVAVSRAINNFVVLQPQNMPLSHGTNLGDLVRYIKYNTSKENETESHRYNSIFDILYDPKYIERYAPKYDSHDGSEAEKIFEDMLINEILPSHTSFNNIRFIREYKLRDLVKDIDQFEENEQQFMRNNSRLDFLLFNKIDRIPILVIEVDGVSYHNNPIQQRRDRLKDNILSKIEVPILRLATDGLNEKEKTCEVLLKSMEGKS